MTASTNTKPTNKQGETMNTKTTNAGRLYLHDGGECYCYEHAPFSLRCEIDALPPFKGREREIWTPRGGWSDLSPEWSKALDVQFARQWNLGSDDAYETACDDCRRR